MKKIEFRNNSMFSYLIKDYFEIFDYEFESEINEEPVKRIKMENKKQFYELYDYQYIIKQKAFNILADNKKRLYKILIHMPTGTGKTKTTMHIISQYLNFVSKGEGVIIWVAHSNELLRQAYNTFLNVWTHLAGFDINVYSGWVDFPDDVQNGILFTSIQSLESKMNTRPETFEHLGETASLIIFDEVHKSGAPVARECIDKLMRKDNEYNKKFIGLTATPGRTTEISKENSMFADEFESIINIDVDLINKVTLSEAEARNYNGSKDPIRYFQENEYLSKIEKEVLNYEVSPDLKIQIEKEIKNKTDDFSNTLVNKIAITKSRNMEIVNRIIRLNKDKVPTIVFACSVKHAKMLSAFLKLMNIDNSLVYGEMDNYDRIRAIEDFKNNKVGVIINYDILTTGFDSTNIRCVFITKPTKSVIKYSQMIGRGLRGPKMGGNKTCLLIDVKENLITFDENKAFNHFDKYWGKE